MSLWISPIYTISFVDCLLISFRCDSFGWTFGALCVCVFYNFFCCCYCFTCFFCMSIPIVWTFNLHKNLVTHGRLLFLVFFPRPLFIADRLLFFPPSIPVYYFNFIMTFQFILTFFFHNHQRLRIWLICWLAMNKTKQKMKKKKKNYGKMSRINNEQWLRTNNNNNNSMLTVLLTEKQIKN